MSNAILFYTELLTARNWEYAKAFHYCLFQIFYIVKSQLLVIV